MKHSTAAQALLAARNYRDTALRARAADPLEAQLHEATALFHQAISLRRLGQFVEAQSLYTEAAAELDQLTEKAPTDLAQNRVIQARADLTLDQAILAFQKKDYLESARMNLKAACLANALGENANELRARALLNAAISWDRLGEIQNARRDLELANSAIKDSPNSPLQTSIALFQWRLEFDNGPMPGRLQESSLKWNPSQLMLLALYTWEYELLAGTRTTIAQARTTFARLRAEFNNHQYDSTLENLSAITEWLLQGPDGATRARFSPLIEILEKRAQNKKEELPEGTLALAYVLAVSLLSESQWKKLEKLSSTLKPLQHPFTNRLAERVDAWVAISRGTEKTGTPLPTSVNQELALLQMPETQDISEAPLLENIIRALSELVPSSAQKFLHITQAGVIEVTDTEAARLRNLPENQKLFFWDGLQATLGIINLNSKPVLMRLLSAIISKYPMNLSREELVPLVWDESYNPLVHDNLLHGAVCRLRRLMPKSCAGEIEWESAGLRWKGVTPFSALIPIRGTTRVIANDSRLSERQVRILTLLKYRGSIRKADVLKALEISERTAVRELHGLVQMKLCHRQGKGPATLYFPFSG
ncbi:MAG TPA: hypothetical protein DCS07_02565 [Bdellovibrionales bacterium]|nr:hypothetical protein [Bdellovibrionales bacterium]